jgi:hypothetical protein
MSRDESTFSMPPIPKNSKGDERTIGLELEFGGLGLEKTTELVRESFGGVINRKSDYEAVVENTRYGDFRIELDAELFRKLKVRDYFKKIGLDDIEPGLGDSLEEIMASAAAKVVPWEIVFPPVPISSVPEMDELAGRIRKAGAEGTGSSILHAFGLHLNPELPDTDPATVLTWLKAFLVLYDSLLEELNVDISREITPFIDPFPDEYVRMVLQPDYHPDKKGLIDDYIRHNPTRNRPLDMLPVLAWMDEDQVTGALPDQKIGKRPTLHYRLPNSRIDEAGWSFTLEWNQWLPVEKLAADPDRLDSLARRYLYHLKHPVRSRALAWLDEIREEIRDVFGKE